MRRKRLFQKTKKMAWIEKNVTSEAERSCATIVHNTLILASSVFLFI